MITSTLGVLHFHGKIGSERHFELGAAMLIHRNNQAMVRHWFKDHGEGDNGPEGTGSHPGERRACVGSGRAVRDDQADRLYVEAPLNGA